MLLFTFATTWLLALASLAQATISIIQPTEGELYYMPPTATITVIASFSPTTSGTASLVCETGSGSRITTLQSNVAATLLANGDQRGSCTLLVMKDALTTTIGLTIATAVAVISLPTEGERLPANQPFTIYADFDPSPGAAELICAQGGDSFAPEIYGGQYYAFSPNATQLGECALVLSNTYVESSVNITLYTPQADIVAPLAGAELPANVPFDINVLFDPSPGNATLSCAAGLNSTLSNVQNAVSAAFTPNADQLGVCTLTAYNEYVSGEVLITLVLPGISIAAGFNYGSFRSGRVYFSAPSATAEQGTRLAALEKCQKRQNKRRELR